ncbi:putative C4-dicarboxylate ABC transporter substrate binding protein [Candidatus Vecturithrix granuli]|uniref:Putative C4-dicarboxylate ABC transporter substrate binding protein n=1 Tax=Vecturithrix granuli TaxID=1499967 RepID=A0A081C5R3_VECG1|nr:putative C4-dicarboxylate ABC transporter substrate binding protein [Candidatus Vecturithrix granuli]
MKKGVVLAVIFILVCGIASFAGAKTTFRLAHVYNPDHAWDRGAHLAAKIVAEKTNGEIEIEVFPSSQLGTEEQITEAVIFGSIDMCVSGAGQIGNLFKPIYVLEMPYTFKDNNHVLRFAKSDVAQKMFEDLGKEFQIKVIGTSSYGIRQVLSVNKPIYTPEDLKGFKLRVPEQQITVEYGKAMGADPTPIAYAEAYMALQQGVVDGLENPLSALQNMKFYEVAKYINMTSHVTNCCFYLMNGDKFNSLTKEHQEIILEAFDEASKLIVEILNKDDQELGAFFEKEGLTIIQSDVEAFKKATAAMPHKFRKWWIRYGEDLHQRIQEM